MSALLLFIVNTMPLWAQTTEDQVNSKLFGPSGIELEKIERFGQEIIQRQEELRHSFENDLRERLGHGYWDSKNLSRISYPMPIYDQILKDLNKLPTLKDEKKQYRLAHKILIMDQGVKVVGDKKQLIDLERIWSQLTNFKLPKTKQKRVWKNNDLTTFGPNPFESSRTPQAPTPENLSIERMKTNTRQIVFELSSTDSPKQISLRVGPGIYSEATSASLLAKMGINTYASKVYSNVKTRLSGLDLNELKQQYALVHGEQAPDLDSLIKEVKQTKNGTQIVWHRALLTQKHDMDKFVGAWSPYENGLLNSSFIKSLPLFYLWVGQQEFHKYKGRELYLEQNERDSTEFNLRFFTTRFDKAFGKVLPEAPNDFPWELIASNDEEEVAFNHRIQGLTDYPIDLADTRPMAQRILELTREDIREAVKQGAWPHSVAQLLVEKLISRRNQLIQLYDWVERPETLQVNRNLTTSDSRVQEGELVDGLFPEFHQDFDGGMVKRLKPYLQGLSHLLYGGGRLLLSSFNGLDIAPLELGIDNGLIKRVLFGYNRSIERNQKPTGPDDRYLVKDTFKIGFRLGSGLVISGDVSYVKEYTLIYPVKSRAEGELQNKFILNLLLPYDVHADKLPDQHVLVLSDSLEGRGRIKIGNAMSVIGQSVSTSEINLGRTYVSQKTPDKAFVFTDASLFTELAYRISLELGAIGIPVFRHALRQGTLKRHYYELDLNENSHREALRKIKLWNSTTHLEDIGHVHKIEDTFYESDQRSNFLGLFQSESRTRYDDITEYHQDDPAPDETNIVRRFQMEQFKNRAWSFFDRDENFKSQVLLRAKPQNLELTEGEGLEEIDRPHIELRLFIEDLRTQTKEFEDYIHMINTVARDKNFIPFSPSLHSRNNQWGEVNVALNVDLGERALEKLMQAREQDYWNALAKVTGRPVSYWARALSTNLRNRRHLEIRNRDSFLASRLKSMARHLRNVGRDRKDLWRMRSLHAAFTRAIYTSGQAYRPTLLAVIHEITGKENIFVEAMISVPPEHEGHLPGRRPLYNKLGDQKDQGHPFYQFYFEQASQVYNAF